MPPSSKSSSPSKSKSTKPSSSKTSSSKNPSKHDSDSEDEHPSSSRKISSKSSSSSSSKKNDKKEKTSLLKSIFTKDKSDTPVLSSKHFKDESQRPSKSTSSSASKGEKLDSALFRDESRAPKKGKSEKLDSAMFRDESRSPKAKSEKVKSGVKAESVRYKSEKKKKPEKIEEEEYAEEPDFADFQSKYSAPEEVKKMEKSAKPEKKVEKSAKPEMYKSRYESAKVESKAIKSTVNFKTAFTSEHDVEMAAKQTQIAELKGEELEEQEKWALEKLKAHAGTCPMGFSWSRYTEEACGEQERLDGYRCKGGAHLVTHEMIAKGEGGAMNITIDFSMWEFEWKESQEPGWPYPMPDPFTGLRWEILKDEDNNPLSRLKKWAGNSGPDPFQQFGSLGLLPFGRLPGGGGIGGSGYRPGGLSPLDPNYPLGQYGGQQQQQPGGPSGFPGFGGSGPNAPFW